MNNFSARRNPLPKSHLSLFDPESLDSESIEIPPIVRPPIVPPGIDPQMRLRAWFKAKILPGLMEQIEIGQRSQQTLELYENALTHWEQKATDPLSPGGKTLDPPITNISEEVVKDFRKRLMKEQFLMGKRKGNRTNQTVNKIMRHLRRIVRSLFPKDSRNPKGHGVIELFPWPEELRRQKTLTFTFSRKELSSLYLGCAHCKSKSKYSRHKSPMHCPHKWRTALVLALNCGARTWDLFKLEWSSIHWDKFKYGAVWFQSRKTAKIQMVPLNRVARIHLEHLRKQYPNEKLIFEGFKKNSTFYRAWERIETHAGVTAPFESMRKTCSTLHDDVLYGVGAFILGHSPRGVNATSYDNPTPRVTRTVYRLKCPAEFRRGAQSLSQASS